VSIFNLMVARPCPASTLGTPRTRIYINQSINQSIRSRRRKWQKT